MQFFVPIIYALFAIFAPNQHAWLRLLCSNTLAHCYHVAAPAFCDIISTIAANNPYRPSPRIAMGHQLRLTAPT
jgi:hypothetical protein